MILFTLLLFHFLICSLHVLSRFAVVDIYSLIYLLIHLRYVCSHLIRWKNVIRTQWCSVHCGRYQLTVIYFFSVSCKHFVYTPACICDNDNIVYIFIYLPLTAVSMYLLTLTAGIFWYSITFVNTIFYQFYPVFIFRNQYQTRLIGVLSCLHARASHQCRTLCD